MTANESQNPPYEESAVAPKVFPTAISLRNDGQRCAIEGMIPELIGGGRTYHMPASNWTKPPYPKARPTTILGALNPRVPMLIKPKTKVVKAKALKPNGAGLAIPRSLTCLYRPGWNSPPKAGRRCSPLAVLTWARGP